VSDKNTAIENLLLRLSLSMSVNG